MLETQIGAASPTATASLDFPGYSVGREIARQHVAAITAVVARRIVLLEFTHLGIEQSAAQLVAKRIPHDRVHADKPWRKVANGKELHELHVDEFGAGAQRQRIAVTAHVGRRAVAAIKPAHPPARTDPPLAAQLHGFPRPP